MKIKYIAFALAFLSTESFAITGKDSWSKLRSSGEVMILQPTFAGIFGPEGLFNACTTDHEFKSIKVVKNCIEFKEVTRESESGFFKDYICTSFETKHVSIRRNYIKNVCANFSQMTAYSSSECLQYESRKSVYPTTFSFIVIEASGEEFGNFLFSKTFALQSCD